MFKEKLRGLDLLAFFCFERLNFEDSKLRRTFQQILGNRNEEICHHSSRRKWAKNEKLDSETIYGVGG